MKNLLPLLLLAVLAVTSRSQTPAPAPVNPAPAAGLADDETARILEEITKVQREFAKTKKDLLASALERFKAASASDAQAGDFYLAAYRVVNLDRKPATTKEEQEERANGEWQKKALAALGEGASSAPLRMQLQLLVMMLESSDTEETGAVVERLRSFMQGVIAFLPTASTAAEQPPARRPVATVGKKGKKDDEPRGREQDGRRPKNGATRNLRQSVMASIFAEAYNLGAYFEPPAQWPHSPADFRAAYLNVIIPWFRANKKTELPVVWDEYLKAETTMQQINLPPDALVEWGAKEYKQLHWSKCLDLLSNGVNATASAGELVKIVRENPSHPSLKTWIADLANVAEAMGGLKFEEAAPSPAK
jgi:hypothetical protein